MMIGAKGGVNLVEMSGCASWYAQDPFFRLLYYSHRVILLYFKFYINKEACLHFKKERKTLG